MSKPRGDWPEPLREAQVNHLVSLLYDELAPWVSVKGELLRTHIERAAMLAITDSHELGTSVLRWISAAHIPRYNGGATTSRQHCEYCSKMASRDGSTFYVNYPCETVKQLTELIRLNGTYTLT